VHHFQNSLTKEGYARHHDPRIGFARRHWAAVVPTSQPPWLTNLKPYLATPDIASNLNDRIDYQIILGGDYLIEFIFCPIYSDQRFSLVSTVGAGCRVENSHLNVQIKYQNLHPFILTPCTHVTQK
jgi:hypothetical protein